MCRLTGSDFDGKFTYLLIIGRKDGVKITPVGDWICCQFATNEFNSMQNV